MSKVTKTNRFFIASGILFLPISDLGAHTASKALKKSPRGAQSTPNCAKNVPKCAQDIELKVNARSPRTSSADSGSAA